METAIFSLIGLGFFSVFMIMFILWVVHLIAKNAGVVDIGWGIGLVMISWIYFLMGPGYSLRMLLMLLLVMLWGFRITYFILMRVLHENEEDRRYQTFREEWKTQQSLKFFFFFQFQAVLQIILSLPFLLVALNANARLSLWVYLGMLIVFVSIAGETVADEQLSQFKKNPDNKGKVCDAGLWYYSRHPNYFFEWLIWVGFFIYALGSPWGWLSVTSPVIMFYLLVKVSGIPMAEAQSLQSRGERYRHYQQTTSPFFPLPKRAVSGQLSAIREDQ